MINVDLMQTYRQTIAGCGLVDLPDHARLWATGRDRIDLINRMSTNDLEGMVPGEGRATVLTNAVGRMIDRIVVVHLGERALILGSAGTARTIQRWLSGYVFYNDDVTFADAAGSLGQFVLFGPGAESTAEALAASAAGLPPYHVKERDGVVVGRDNSLAGGSFFVVGPPEMLRSWREAALVAGAVEASREVYEVVRIESGRPEYGHEIGESYIPLEAGLWADVSFSKGCYIGQEIIARMESRGKLAKTLVGVQAAGPLAAGTTFPGGTVTSAIESPRFGWIGLAFVKPAEADPGRELTIAGVPAKVAPLPFRG